MKRKQLDEQQTKEMLIPTEDIPEDKRKKERQSQGENATEEWKLKAELKSAGVSSTSAEQSTSPPKRQRHGGGADAAVAGLACRVAKDFKTITNEVQKAKHDDFLHHVKVTIPDETNMNVWNISLSQALFKSNAGLHKDLTTNAKQQNGNGGNVSLEAIFPARYPFGAPFIRIVRPKFKFHTGHVTIGGSICMELLTDSGWLPSFSIESILVQIVHAIVEGGGRLQLRSAGLSYSRKEAQAAFTKAAQQHRWKISN